MLSLFYAESPYFWLLFVKKSSIITFGVSLLIQAGLCKKR